MNAKRKSGDCIPLLVLALSVLSYARILANGDVYLDDNCWLLGLHLSGGVSQFLDYGFTQLRREPLGVFLYLFFLPHRYLGDTAIAIWHTITLGIQLATPLVLYFLVRKMTDGRRDMAALAAMMFVVGSMDQMAPYLSSINYRIGLLCGLLSLFLTDLSLTGQRTDHRRLATALLIGSAGAYVFHESVVAFEPARLFMLWYRLGRPVNLDANRWRRILLVFSPFVAISLPLLAYKLLYKPFGVFSGYYEIDFTRLADSHAISGALRLFLTGKWGVLQKFLLDSRMASVILAVIAGITVTVVLSGILKKQDSNKTNTAWPVIAFGTILLLPQFILFGIAGRLPGAGDRSVYAILAQPGISLIAGAVVWGLVVKIAIAKQGISSTFASFLLGTISAVGVFLNNLNLDVFAAASEREATMWKAFENRFTALPDRADFFLDLRATPYAQGERTFFDTEDLHGTCAPERQLARRYPSESDGPEIRRYRVFPVRRLAPDYRQFGPSILGKDVEVTSQFGNERFHPADFVVVRFHGDELLVNQEITERFPDIFYRLWADKPVPDFVGRR